MIDGGYRRSGRPAIPLGLCLIAIHLACGGPSPVQEGQTTPETAPIQSFRNLELRETTGGKLEWVLAARQAWRSTGKGATGLAGVRVDFYQGSERVRSVLTADSGSVDSRQGILMAIGNVVVVTAEGNRLETEELHWDRKNSKVSSDRAVRLTRGEDLLTGVGFESDPNLEHFELFKDVKASVREADTVGDEIFDADSSGRAD